MNADLNDPVVVQEICDRLVSGSSMAKICAADDMPAESTVYLRMARDAEFRSVIARAREAQQDAEIDRTIDMADAATAEDHQVVKLRIWARQWRAAKLAPKRYGEKQLIGSDPDNPLPVGTNVIAVGATMEEAAEAYRRLIQGA